MKIVNPSATLLALHMLDYIILYYQVNASLIICIRLEASPKAADSKSSSRFSATFSSILSMFSNAIAISFDDRSSLSILRASDICFLLILILPSIISVKHPLGRHTDSFTNKHSALYLFNLISKETISRFKTSESFTIRFYNPSILRYYEPLEQGKHWWKPPTLLSFRVMTSDTGSGSGYWLYCMRRENHSA